MKKILMVAIVVLAFASTHAQKNIAAAKVLLAAKDAFAKAHPNTAPRWEKEDGIYEVSFKEGGKDMSCVITLTGNILETETSMPVMDLPPAVTTYIRQHYKGVKVKEAATIKKADGTTEYEALINGKDVMFDQNGNIIKAKKEKD